jgi:hypothetical protein
MCILTIFLYQSSWDNWPQKGFFKTFQWVVSITDKNHKKGCDANHYLANTHKIIEFHKEALFTFNFLCFFT